MNGERGYLTRVLTSSSPLVPNGITRYHLRMRFAGCWALLVGGIGISCGHKECNCSTSDLYIVPSSNVQVAAMTLSGPACESAEIVSVVQDGSSSLQYVKTFVPGALDYHVRPAATGDCTVTVTLNTGRVVEKTVTFRYADGGSDHCCGGYYVDGGDSFFTVYDPDAGTS